MPLARESRLIWFRCARIRGAQPSDAELDESLRQRAGEPVAPPSIDFTLTDQRPRRRVQDGWRWGVRFQRERRRWRIGKLPPLIAVRCRRPLSFATIMGTVPDGIAISNTPNIASIRLIRRPQLHLS